MTQPVITKTYLTYEHPGSFYPETSGWQVDDRDPARDAAAAPESAFSLRYHDVVHTVVDIADDLGTRTVATKSAPLNESKRYLLDAELLTSAQVADLPGDHKILLSNMRANGWDLVARMRTGNFQPFDPEQDEILAVAS